MKILLNNVDPLSDSFHLFSVFDNGMHRNLNVVWTVDLGLDVRFVDFILALIRTVDGLGEFFSRFGEGVVQDGGMLVEGLASVRLAEGSKRKFT